MENELHLTDLIDVEMLQRIQDAFSDMTGIASVTTDADGVAVTKGSHFSDFCMKLHVLHHWAASGVNYAIKTERSWHFKKELLQPISVTLDSWILRTDYCGRQNGWLFYRRSGADRAAGYFKNHAGRR